MKHKLQIAFLIFLTALVVRVAFIESFPPGLWFDEGLAGVDAWKGCHGGGLKLVYPDVFPQEPLFEWMLTGVVSLFGPRILPMRLLPVFIGSLVCALLFLMVSHVERRRGMRIAIVAGFVLATMHWHAHFSRLVFRTNMVPLITVLAVWALSAVARAEIMRLRRVYCWLLAGMVAGVGFYTYLSWYFFLPVLGVWFWALRRDELELIERRTGGAPVPHHSVDNASPLLQSLALYLLGTGIVFLPLAIHYIRFPELLLGRPEAISPFSGGVAAAMKLIARNLRDVVLMFSFRGDHVGKHNVPWSSVLDVCWSLLFYAGIVRAGIDVKRGGPRGRRSLAWLAWLVAMSMPSVLSQTDSANTLRNLGATPAVAYLIALGWWWGMTTAERMRSGWRRWSRVGLIALLLFGAGFQVYKLWVRHPHVANIGNEFNVLQVELARMCQPDPDGAPLFVPRELLDNKTFEFLTIGRADVRPVDAVAILSQPAAEQKAQPHRVLCWGVSANPQALQQIFPQGVMEGAPLMMGEYPFAWIYRIPADMLFPLEKARDIAPRLERDLAPRTTAGA